MWNDEEFVNELMNAEKLPKLIEEWKSARKFLSILLFVGIPLFLCLLLAVGSNEFTANFGGPILLSYGLVLPPLLINAYHQDTQVKLAMLIQTLRERKELSAPSDEVQDVSSAAG